MRLDQYLVTHHGFPSRNKAAESIKQGDVIVNDAVVKPSYIVKDTDHVHVLTHPKYVSRSADKLVEAITTFGIDFNHKTVLDVGQSTGGFTQVALAAGARQVIGIEVGHGQLDRSLQDDPRITLYEHTNVKDLRSLALPVVDIGLVDLSFISTIAHLDILLPQAREWLCLIKPQFETKGEGLRYGVVVDPREVHQVLQLLQETTQSNHHEVCGQLACRTKGKQGNQEYMVWIKGVCYEN
jgi:23S rRNA (cytidine1920-2'-O)/16S rRNA (cytidine1409-2'-O)-methyltransferase